MKTLKMGIVLCLFVIGVIGANCDRSSTGGIVLPDGGAQADGGALDGGLDGGVSECSEGEIIETYLGDPRTKNVGICKPEIKKCRDGGYVIIQEGVQSKDEDCDNVDNDCDSDTDENVYRVTYSGTPGTEHNAPCRSNVEQCIRGDYFSLFTEVVDTPEECDGIDNNCDGQQIDEGLPQIISYSGPPSTLNNPPCRPKIMECRDGGYVVAQEEITPKPEICDGLDNDCDEQKDECDPDSNGNITSRIYDANFLNKIMTSLRIWSGVDVSADTARAAGKISAPSSNISSIYGVECFINLGALFLGHNQISDLFPISGLTSLTLLRLRDNQIRDISDLSRLTSLSDLGLGNNQISNIFSLRELTSLNKLWLDNNQISDISHLSELRNLTVLWLDGNQISDISHLSELRKLVRIHLNHNRIENISSLQGLQYLMTLDLSDNRIRDIGPLILNPGLCWGGFEHHLSWNPEVDLRGNPGIPCWQIETLRNKGVTVEYDDCSN